MMSDTLELLSRVLLGFAVLLILVRVIGNKQLGQLNVFTYISGIVIGSMIGDIILHNDINLWMSMSGVAAWVVLAVFIETVSLKSIRARELLDGQPIIIVKKGVIMYDALKKERMNIDDLTMMLRTNNVFSVQDVDYAILEPNGDLSILKKQEKENITREDMNKANKQRKYIPTALIMDGRIIVKNLSELNLSAEWLENMLKNMEIRDGAEVLYAEIQEDGHVYIQLRNGCVKNG